MLQADPSFSCRVIGDRAELSFSVRFFLVSPLRPISSAWRTSPNPQIQPPLPLCGPPLWGVTGLSDTNSGPSFPAWKACLIPFKLSVRPRANGRPAGASLTSPCLLFQRHPCWSFRYQVFIPPSSSKTFSRAHPSRDSFVSSA